jgi:hypothetical protein
MPGITSRIAIPNIECLPMMRISNATNHLSIFISIRAASLRQSSVSKAALKIREKSSRPVPDCRRRFEG